MFAKNPPINVRIRKRDVRIFFWNIGREVIFY